MGLMFSTLNSQGQKFAGVLSVFLFLSLIVSVLLIASTYMTGLLSEAAVEGNQDEIIRFLLFLAGIMVIRVVASGLSVLVLGRFGAVAGFRYRENFARYFLQKPFSRFTETKTGESLSIFTNDLPHAVDLTTDQAPRMIADIITLLVTIVYMLTVNWWLTIIFFASFPLLIAMQVLIAAPLQKKQALSLEATARFNAKVNDSFQNTSTVAAFSLEKVMEKRITDAFDEVIVAGRNYVKSMLSLVLAGILASTTPIYIIAVILAQQVIGEHLTFAEFIVFFGLAGEAGGWLQMLSQRQNNVKTAEAGAKRLVGHIDKSVEDVTSGKELDKQSEIAVCAKNLKFSYGEEEDAPLALDGVSFRIKRGARIAFVGGSGSGKTTVLKLLLRLYEPTDGELSIMGVNSSEVSLASLRGAISYVPQDSFLFPESIAGNITGHDTPPDMARLEKAASDAGILDFVKSLPDRWNAVLSESAENISGGQKQRIALARAFYKEAEIILFDEATSSLDPVTEAEVIKSFENLGKDKTLVMVAHRLKAIRFCDEIIVLENGKVAGIGSHEELLSTNTAYRNLYESQEKEVA